MDETKSSDTKITIYSAQWCAFCKMVKQYLTDRQLKFTEIDIEQDQDSARLILDKTGQMGVPVIDIDGIWILGFDRVKIDAALKEKQLV